MKARKGRFLAGLLSAAMLVSACPSAAYAAEAPADETSNIIAQFNFDDETNGFIGGGAKATVEGVTLSDEAVIGKSAYFDGVNDFLSVTKEDGSSLLTGKNAFSISYLRKIETAGAGNWTFFAAPSTDRQTYRSEKYIGVLEKNKSLLVERYNSNSEDRPAQLEKTGVDTGWKMISIVFDEGGNTAYVDGVEVKTSNANPVISNMLKDNSIVQIGKANWDGGEYFKGYIDNFTIYDGALTADEVSAIYENTQKDMEAAAKLAKIKSVKEKLEATILDKNDSASNVTKSIKLPSSIDGISFEYTISDESVIGKDGSILYSGVEGKEVTVTAVGSLDGEEVISQTISLVVCNPLKADFNALEIANADNIRGNITLATVGESGSAITWSSSDETVVSTEVVKNENYADTPAGLVNRQAEDVKVTLTATLSNGDETLTKEFELTVKAKAEIADTTDYIFAYFTGNTISGENIYFATSQDGYNFDEINNGQYVLTSELGEKGLRDPFIIRSHEGDKFYLIATDLSIGRNGDWTRAQTGGSQAIMVWESEDLINWSEQRMAVITDTIGAGCTWAPEAYYDEITGEYVVFWASKTPVDNYYTHRIYYSKTRDFVNFTKPEVWIDRTPADGSNHGASTIDTTIVAGNDGYLYRISKNEGGTTAYYRDAEGKETSEKVTEKTVYMEKSKSLFGTWTRVKSSTLESIPRVEGPTSYKLNGDDADVDTWVLLLDHYGDGGFKPAVTTNIDDDVVIFTAPSEDDYDLPSSPRHGTVMQITADEYKKVMQAYGTIDTSSVPSFAKQGTMPELPASLPVQVSSTDYEEVAVAWAVKDGSFDEAGKVTLVGTLAAINRTVEVVIEVSANTMVYFIDSGVIATDNSSPKSAAYEKYKESLGDALLNYSADQLYEEGSWGYVNDNDSTSGLYSSSTDDIFSNGWWARSGQNCEYILPLASGKYIATGYFAEWWNYNSNRKMNFYAQYKNDEGETVTSDITSVMVSNSDRVTKEFTFEVKGVANTADVHFIVEKAASADPVISGLSVEKIADRNDDLIASYSFTKSDVADTTAGTKIADESGNDNDAKLQGAGATMVDGSLHLPGGGAGSNAAYVELPGAMFEGQDELTISVWFKNETGAGNYAGLFFGTPTANYGNGSGSAPVNYWLLNPAAPGGYFKSVWTNGDNAGSPWNTETKTSSFLTGSEWAMYTTVITADSITGYYNGQEVCTASKTKTTSDFGKNLVAAIGRSGYKDIFYKGGVSNLKVYSRALSAKEIAADLSEGGISKDMASVDLGNVTDITEDIELPTEGKFGSKITWASSNKDVISPEGKVTRPAVDGSYTVVLTATFELDGEKETKKYTVTVAGGSPETVFKEQMKLFDLGLVRVDSDIELPTAIAMDGSKIEWSSNNKAITAEGKVTRPAAGQSDISVKLTAQVTYDKDGIKLEDTKSFDLVVRAEDYGYLLAYTATNEAEALGYSLHLAYSTDGENFTALNSNTGIAFANNAGGSKSVNPNSLGSTKLFRKADGTYAFVAANKTTAGKYIYVFDSENLVNFANETKLAVTKVAKTILAADYNAKENVYEIYFTGSDNKTYLTKTVDLITAISTEVASYEGDTSVDAATLPKSANKDGNILAVSKDEYKKVVDKLGTVKNTGFQEVKVEVASEDEVTTAALPGKVTADYTDGSTADWNVAWDSATIKQTSENTYTVTGTIQQEKYDNPLIEHRADPCILLGSDGYYYFTASYPMDGGSDVEGYDRVVLRRSKTIAGLSEAEEITIWDCHDDSKTEFKYIWAPEIHEINGTYYVFYTSSVDKNSVWGIRPHVMRCNDSANIMEKSSWEAMGTMQAVAEDTQAFTNFSLDMTIFQNTDGRWYVMWAQTDGYSSIFIAEVDPEQPWKCISKSAKIAVPEFAWERINENVDEGPNVLISNGKLYCTFSAAATGVEYCIGLMTADATADLLDPASWVKQAYPILTSSDVEGEYGPGHNSFTLDENGNVIFVYHARGQECYDNKCQWRNENSLYDPCRDARVKRVHWAADGSPILKMTYDEELLTTTVTATITVKAAEPTPEVTPAVTPTGTPEVTPTPEATPTGTPAVTPTGTPEVTPTPEATPTGTPAVTPTGTPAVTPTGTPAVTPTATPAVEPEKATPTTVASPEVTLKANKISLKKAATVTVKAKKSTKKLASTKTFKLSQFVKVNGSAKLTYAKASGNKNITVSKNGKVTVKKGLKRGNYKIKVKISAASTSQYKAATTTKTFTIKVK